MDDHFVGKVTQKAIIVRDGKVLLGRDVGNDTYDIPGGRIHFNEVPESALKREVKEELSVDIKVGAPFFVCTTTWGYEKSPHYFIAFKCELSPETQQAVPDGVEVEEARWISKSELSEVLLHPECVKAIQAYFN